MDRDRGELIVAAAHSYGRLPGALRFVLGLVDYAICHRPLRKRAKHCTPCELAYGARLFAVQQYGDRAHVILAALGIRTSADLGDCVFALIGTDLLIKSKRDKLSQFDHLAVYNEESFQPLYSQLLPTAQP